MIDSLPKDGCVPKGKYLSLHFFENKIAKNINNVRIRVRDYIIAESKKKRRKEALLTEEEYMDLYFQAHSFEVQSKWMMLNNNNYTNDLITQEFIDDYCLFYEPKWKIWFSGTRDIRILAMLNHLAYGYFYEINKQLGIVCVIKKSTWKKDSCRFVLRSKLEIELGTIKWLQNRKVFYYYDYISYNQRQIMTNGSRKIYDSRKKIKKGELCKKLRQQKEMSIKNLKIQSAPILEPYYCPSYEINQANQKEIQNYLLQLQAYFLSPNDAKNTSELEKDEKILEEEEQINNHITFSIINKLKVYKFAEVIQKIPDFQYKLSLQQKKLIQSKGNVIGIGRSGTGKTTCALLKIFSLELIYKIELARGRKLLSSDIESPSKMKNLFLTVSSLLTGEIKKKYEMNIKNTISYLKKKENSHQQHENEANADTTTRNNLIEEADQQREELNAINKNSNSLNLLSPESFPGFFTLRNFFIMLDGIYTQNFFFRKPDKNLYEKKIDTIQADNMKAEQRYYKSQNIQIKEMSYSNFEKIFWKIQILPRKDLKFKHNPLVVWTEIFSTIQGSTFAYKCSDGHITEQKYLISSKNKFISEEQKKQIFFIFMQYRKWKFSKQYFDETDLINYLLRKISYEGYLGPIINFLFVDQVQDLVPAAIYLISKIVSNDIFFAGDTAQAISKGVIFNFEDIKEIFQEGATERINKEEIEIMKLTVNFRSHNKILKVANFLVRVMEILFPKTITKLIKQTSTQEGPKPIIVNSPDQIIQILSYNSGKKDNRVFLGNNQVIIIRDQSEIQEVQKYFGNAVIWTIKECKGLQKQDIILWNLFPNDYEGSLWKILDFLIINKDVKIMKEIQQILENGSILDDIQQIVKGQFTLKGMNRNEYYNIFMDLKLLYTAVTRARDLLIIYRSLPLKLEAILENLELVDRFTEQTARFIGIYKSQKNERKLNGLQEESIMKRQAWKEFGLDCFRRRQYRQAWTCFNNINERQMCRYLEALMYCDEAKELAEEIQVKKNEGDVQDLHTQYKEKLKSAAEAFIEVGKVTEGGKIYFQAEEYKKACQYFESLKMYYEMGECQSRLNNHIRAAKLFEKCEKYGKMLNEIYLTKNYEFAMVQLFKYREKVVLAEFKNKIQSPILETVNNFVVRDYESRILEAEQTNRTINTRAFYLFNPIPNRLFYHQQFHNGEYRLLGKMVECARNIPKQIIQKLRLAFCVNQGKSPPHCFNCNGNSIHIIKQLIADLQQVRRYQICLILSDQICYYNYFEEYLALTLYNRYCQSAFRSEIISIRKDLSQLNFQQLHFLQKYEKPDIVNKIVKNLMFCGFYRDCSIFFEDKKQFYKNFMMDTEYFQIIKDQFCKKNYTFFQTSKNKNIKLQELKLNQQQKKIILRYLFNQFLMNKTKFIKQQNQKNLLKIKEQQKTELKTQKFATMKKRDEKLEIQSLFSKILATKTQINEQTEKSRKEVF